MLDPIVDDIPPRTPYEELKRAVKNQGWEIERLRVEVKRLHELINDIRDWRK